MTRRGIVWIASTDPVPSGLMADPDTSTFWASWQDDCALEDVDIVGAEDAIAWGKQRADVIRIRLGHSEGTYFSAGDTPATDLPPWPPAEPPSGGWWTPGDPRTPPTPPLESWRVEVRPAIQTATRRAP